MSRTNRKIVIIFVCILIDVSTDRFGLMGVFIYKSIKMLLRYLSFLCILSRVTTSLSSENFMNMNVIE